ncbi:DNA polymerase kappa [Hypsibius exemplaris]|uniref:DNA polymerase kappa n=1 Tax=Hypsibius exemplaris TaxID=2072580 RepID=A0A1W0X7N0_HYPEX|nr:DNA polymerase kappa [Hypsibius exemplaris]
MAEFCGGALRLNDNKAGLCQEEGGLSKEDVSRILTEASEGSPFFENKKQRHQVIERRITAQQKILADASEEERNDALVKADQLLRDIENARNLSKSIVHVDMDMFYAAVEMRDDPSLREKPLGVGSNSMLATSNYVARKFGVRAAQPGFMARKLCPDLVIVPPNFKKYSAVGAVVRQVFAEYDPNFSSYSLDEACLDITEHLTGRHLLGVEERTLWRCDCDYQRQKDLKWSPTKTTDRPTDRPTDSETGDVKELEEEIVERCEKCGRPAEKIVTGSDAEGAVLELRTKVFQRTSLTCSAGIAPNTMLAKICTDKNKPNGQYQLASTREAVMGFIKDLPVRKIPGIGAATEEMLRALGVQTCSDIHAHRAELALSFSDLSLEHFMRVSLGVGSTVVGGDDDREKKSISNERTFRELSKPADLFKKLEELTEDLAQSMQDEELCGKCVTIKIKLVNFESRTRAHTVPHLIRRADEIFPIAKKLLEHEIRLAGGQLKLRLMGVRVSQLQPASASDHQQQSTLTKYFRKSPAKSPNTAKQNGLRLKRRDNDEASLFDPPGPSKKSLVPNRDNDEASLFDLPGPSKKSLVPNRDIILIDEDTDSSSSVDVKPPANYSEVVCPNCRQTIRTDRELMALNRHVDECLNRQFLLTETATNPSSARKKLRLSDSSVASPKNTRAGPSSSRKITDYLKR